MPFIRTGIMLFIRVRLTSAVLITDKFHEIEEASLIIFDFGRQFFTDAEIFKLERLVSFCFKYRNANK